MDCKLTWNSGANTYTFAVDSFDPTIIHRQTSGRTTDNTLKSYIVGNNKYKWKLGFRNITSTIESNFKTIWDVKDTLAFYPDATSGTNYNVLWIGNYPFKKPIRASHQFTGTLYEGIMILEEI